MTTEEKAAQIAALAEDAKAERIETLDVRAKTPVTEMLVVCSGNSDVHVRSIAERIREQMREAKTRPQGLEGEGTGWVLLDFGDVICHVMREEQRQFYDLESLWTNLPTREDLP